jgi:transposase
VLSHAPGTSVWAPEVTDRNGSGIQAVTIQASSPHPRRPRAEGPSGRGLRRQRRSRWGRGEAEQLLQADENCPPWALRAGCRLALTPPPNPLNTEIFVGVDISKEHLDVAFGPDQAPQRFPYTPEGVNRLLAHLQALSPTLIVLEATGGLEADLMDALSRAGLPFSRVNPRRVRDFARASGVLAKTDRLDARILAEFGQKMRPPVTVLPDEHTRHLEILVARRRQLVEMRAIEEHHWRTAPETARPYIRKHLEWLDAEIATLEREIADWVNQTPLAETVEILDSAPGVALVGAATLVAEVPEIGRLNRKKIAALVGVAPYNRDSGTQRRQRRVTGGRQAAREVLYMLTIAGIRCNPVLRTFYQRLRAAGKPPKVAIVACMRKLLTILNAMVRDRRKWCLELAG